MKIQRFEVWVADLNPRMGTEAGKIRPVLVVQTDILNRCDHPSTLICPITTNIQLEAQVLRVNISNGIAGLDKTCDVMIDQLRAIDNRRLKKRLGLLPSDLQIKVNESLIAVLDLI